uniref:Uncharacterized protein n=1 Tax=Picea glauca TaxID=3330 RepID=A0A101M4R9_PICGL|nr:hypothetical protein ABT39_MTgene940 [Picea glauca]QHR90977.1 hypothetical protein Q903MT_gene5006 [Picea sitchensis]
MNRLALIRSEYYFQMNEGIKGLSWVPWKEETTILPGNPGPLLPFRRDTFLGVGCTYSLML